MRFTDEEKQEILRYRGQDPCSTCSVGAACCGCGCTLAHQYRVEFARAEVMGVLEQAKRFNKAVALNIKMQKVIRELSTDIEKEIAALNMAGLPKKLITERLQEQTKFWLPS